MHLLKGTYRPDRHGPVTAPPPREDRPVTPAARRRVLAGLSPEGRRLAVELLDEYGGWDAASLTTLRLYVESALRLAGPLDDTERRRETRVYLGLLRALELGR